ncbi:hypothetical protein B296_00058939 [Ensete ventricosum]|uniref:Uncharacterized protein n=1 Tax=Ensete ventricosum TaxID=4639 RepID=A0A426XJV2_ENSVE|nr:hypothetical protein B296_00058939 [Ensete ventricosum]
MTQKNTMIYSIKSKTSSDTGTCVDMSATNPHFPLADLLEIHLPDPKAYARTEVGKRSAHDEDLDITFRSGSKEYPCHDDALVISIRMGNAYVKRVMIDMGSSADILYFDIF